MSLKKYTVKEARDKLIEINSKRKMFSSQLVEKKKSIRSQQLRINTIKQGNEVIRQAVVISQQLMQENVSTITNEMLKFIFDRPYTLNLDFNIAYGKSSIKMRLERDGYLFNPKNGTGGGVKDVAGLALRWAVWAITRNRTSPIMIYDEPLKDLSKDLHDRALNIIDMFIKKFDVQVIMSTHEVAFINEQDNIMRVNNIDDKSVMEAV